MGNENQKESEEFIFGLRIMWIDTNSPLKNKVELYQDFIRSINEETNLRPTNLPNIEQRLKNAHTCNLKVYNFIKDTTREISVKIDVNEDFLNLNSILGIKYKCEELEVTNSKILKVVSGKI